MALVTGANTGVGFQIAKALIENNYTVFVGARNLENGINAASQLGNNAIAIELDVTKQNTISAAVEKSKHNLENSTCWSTMLEFHMQVNQVEQWRKSWQVTDQALLLLTRHVLFGRPMYLELSQ